MTKIISTLDTENIIWNNLDIRNFYVSPDGTLRAFDFSEAVSNPATAVADKANQLRTFLFESLRKMYLLLFANDPIQAGTSYVALLTQARGTDAQLGVDLNAVLPLAWTWNDIKAIIANSLGANLPPANPNQPFGGGLSGLVGDTAATAADFDANIIAFLNRDNHKPYSSTKLTNIAVADHAGAVAAVQGNNGFGIDANVLGLIINPATDAAYVDLATMCANWTGL
jgi:hypothetical protein